MSIIWVPSPNLPVLILPHQTQSPSHQHHRVNRNTHISLSSPPAFIASSNIFLNPSVQSPLILFGVSHVKTAASSTPTNRFPLPISTPNVLDSTSRNLSMSFPQPIVALECSSSMVKRVKTAL